MPAGATSASFTVTTTSVFEATTATISATYGGVLGTALLTVAPGTAQPVTLQTLSIDPASVAGGSASTGSVTLSGAAPAGGAAVSLSSGNPAAAQVPASVTVPAGQGSAGFTITTSAVAADTQVTITGAYGQSRTATITVLAGPTNTGLRSPSANAADSGGDGNGFESSPSGAHADDAASAVDNNGGTASSTTCTSTSRDRHRFFNYGLSVPAGSTIPGIEVRLDARADSTSDTPRMCVQLSWNGGASWTAAKSTPTLSTSMAAYVLGSATDTWGRTWTAAELSDADFRVRVINTANSTSRGFFLDWVAVRVTHQGGGGAPALDITLGGVPATIPRGPFFTATASVANAGGSSASGYTVLVSFTPSNALKLENPKNSTQSLPTVAAGGSQSVSWLIRAENAASATLTMTLRNSSGQTVDTVSQTFTITN